MMRKLLVVSVLAIISLSYIGMSLGSDYGVAFVIVNTSDNETVKDVGEVIASINSVGDLDISVTHGYPEYVAYVDFVIQNTGENTIYVNDIKVINNNPTAIDIVVTGISVDYELKPGDTINGRVTISVLSIATKNFNYNFGVDFTFNDIS
jgi:hypothetical protein